MAGTGPGAHPDHWRRRKSINYAKPILAELRAHQVRADADFGTDKINGKVLRAEEARVHTMLVIGPRDMDANNVSIRLHGKGHQGAKAQRRSYRRNFAIHQGAPGHLTTRHAGGLPGILERQATCTNSNSPAPTVIRVFRPPRRTVGVQITCPSCQAAITVPDAPGAPAPKAGKLSMAASPVQHIVTSPSMATSMVRNKKKPNYGLYIGWTLGIAAVVVAIVLAPKALNKYHEHQAAVAAAEAAANAPPPPPPPPPELTADEIVKVGATYKNLPDLSLQGVSVGSWILLSSAPPTKSRRKSQQNCHSSLAVPTCIEWNGPGQLAIVKSRAQSGPPVRETLCDRDVPTLVKNREQALSIASGTSGTLGVFIAGLFFDETNSVAVALKNYAKTNSETLDNDKCYVLTGRIASQDMIFWIRQSDFLIVQSELFLGGKVDDAMLNGLSLAQKAQMERASKLRGSFLEDYQDISTKPINAADFGSEFAPNASPKPRQMNRAKGGKPGG